jgi:hypothetical protein
MKATTLFIMTFLFGGRLPSEAHEEIDCEVTSAHEGLREAAKHAIYY